MDEGLICNYAMSLVQNFLVACLKIPRKKYYIIIRWSLETVKNTLLSYLQNTKEKTKHNALVDGKGLLSKSLVFEIL